MSLSQKNPPTMTAINARLVRLVLSRPGIVRGEISDALGSSPAGAADTIRQLVSEGALQTAGSAPSSGGRPATRLSVAPSLAAAYAHSLSSYGLRSALVDAQGNLLAREMSVIPDAGALSSAICEAEARLSTHSDGPPVVGSVLSLPGLPHPASRAVGKAPWLFGSRELAVGGAPGNTAVLTNAEALLRAELVRDPQIAKSLVLAIDLNDGATAVVMAPEGSRVLVNLSALDGPAWVFEERAFSQRVRKEAERPDSTLQILLESGDGEAKAVCEAEAKGDVAAARLVDKATEEISDFIGQLVRMLRPENVIINAWALTSGICKPDEVRRLLRRRCPAGTASRLSIRYAPSDEWMHVSGGGLCAIERWLLAVEAGQVTPT